MQVVESLKSKFTNNEFVAKNTDDRLDGLMLIHAKVVKDDNFDGPEEFADVDAAFKTEAKLIAKQHPNVAARALFWAA
jgi:hypothetical protein